MPFHKAGQCEKNSIYNRNLRNTTCSLFIEFGAVIHPGCFARQVGAYFLLQITYILLTSFQMPSAEEIQLKLGQFITLENSCPKSSATVSASENRRRNDAGDNNEITVT